MDVSHFARARFPKAGKQRQFTRSALRTIHKAVPSLAGAKRDVWGPTLNFRRVRLHLESTAGSNIEQCTPRRRLLSSAPARASRVRHLLRGPRARPRAAATDRRRRRWLRPSELPPTTCAPPRRSATPTRRDPLGTHWFASRLPRGVASRPLLHHQ